MPISIEVEKDGIILCPICIGIGRIYPFPLLCSEESDGISHEGLSGIECPNCEGLGKIP
jgi:hypothetical protein